jgi:hypothetical protein
MICSLAVYWTGLFKEDMKKQIIEAADVLKNGCTILSQEGCREECSRSSISPVHFPCKSKIFPLPPITSNL